MQTFKLNQDKWFFHSQKKTRTFKDKDIAWKTKDICWKEKTKLVDPAALYGRSIRGKWPNNQMCGWKERQEPDHQVTAPKFRGSIPAVGLAPSCISVIPTSALPTSHYLPPPWTSSFSCQTDLRQTAWVLFSISYSYSISHSLPQRPF